MKIHSASALGFAVRPDHSSQSGAADAGAREVMVFPGQSAHWATLKLGTELILVRAIGARSDGSFLGEVFGLEPGAPSRDRGIRAGHQIAFEAEHVFAFDEGTLTAQGAPQKREEERHHAERLKDQYIATLSQDLPNPLAPIASTIRFLHDKAPQDLRFAIDLLQQQTTQLKRMFDDLLDLSRAQNGALQIKRRRIDLAWILHSAIEEVRQRFEEKRQRFHDNYPQQRIEIDADSARLAQAVSNLLENASRYTPAEGRIELRVECTPQHVSIKVIDSGVGIPHVLHERVFEPFVTVQPGVEGREGLGIGLALVKSIVELHGGVIGLTSEGPGKGTQFELLLPNSKAP